MGKDSAISWTHHTFNPWMGCVEVSPACDNCYARTLVTGRMGLPVWGKNEERRVTSDAYWKQPPRCSPPCPTAGPAPCAWPSGGWRRGSEDRRLHIMRFMA
jgi:hypothetical protein